MLFIGTALLAGGIAAFLALFLTRFFILLIEKINYFFLSLFVIALIISMVFYFSSWMGLLILLVATAIGIVPNVIGVKKSHAMGCLMLPVILFFIL